MHGRRFRDLRLSLTEHCNLACVYCVSERDARKAIPLEHPGALTPAEYTLLVGKLHGLLNLESIRLTGGEPTLYRPLAELTARLKELGIPRVNLTTNGLLLADLAADLREAGLDSVNVSLDALDENVFRRMGRRGDPAKTRAGIEAALATGLPVKINCTVQRGYNEGEITAVLDYGESLGAPVRFLELMNMGHLFEFRDRGEDALVKQAEMLEIIGATRTFKALERENSATANYWETESGYRFGIIANHSAPFCRDCNRLRLDSRGRLFGCLSSENGFSIREALTEDPDLVPILQKAMDEKRPAAFTGSSLSMKAIGG